MTKYIFLFFFILLVHIGMAQSISKTTVYFGHASTIINQAYKQNISSTLKAIPPSQSIQTINIVTYVNAISPKTCNKKRALKRIKKIESYIQKQFSYINKNIFSYQVVDSVQKQNTDSSLHMAYITITTKRNIKAKD